MPPRTSKAPIAKRYQHANSNHAGMASLFLVAGRVDKGTKPRMPAIVDKVYQVVLDRVQARGQAAVLDKTLELDAGDRPLPGNRVACLDVEVDEEERRDGRQVREEGSGPGDGAAERQAGLGAADGHGVSEERQCAIVV